MASSWGNNGVGDATKRRRLRSNSTAAPLLQHDKNELSEEQPIKRSRTRSPKPITMPPKTAMKKNRKPRVVDVYASEDEDSDVAIPQTKQKPILKKRKRSVQKSADQDQDEEENYIVEKILETRIGWGGKPEFYVKWKGWPLAHCTWEPEEHLDNCLKILEEFHKSRAANELKKPQQELKEAEKEVNEGMRMRKRGRVSDEASSNSGAISQEQSQLIDRPDVVNSLKEVEPKRSSSNAAENNAKSSPVKKSGRGPGRPKKVHVEASGFKELPNDANSSKKIQVEESSSNRAGSSASRSPVKKSGRKPGRPRKVPVEASVSQDVPDNVNSSKQIQAERSSSKTAENNASTSHVKKSGRRPGRPRRVPADASGFKGLPSDVKSAKEIQPERSISSTAGNHNNANTAQKSGRGPGRPRKTPVKAHMDYTKKRGGLKSPRKIQPGRLRSKIENGKANTSLVKKSGRGPGRPRKTPVKALTDYTKKRVGLKSLRKIQPGRLRSKIANVKANTSLAKASGRGPGRPRKILVKAHMDYMKKHRVNQGVSPSNVPDTGADSTEHKLEAMIMQLFEIQEEWPTGRLALEVLGVQRIEGRLIYVMRCQPDAPTVGQDETSQDTFTLENVVVVASCPSLIAACHEVIIPYYQERLEIDADGEEKKENAADGVAATKDIADVVSS